MSYMFQAVPPPIIRSSKTVRYSIGYFVKPLLLPVTVVEEMEMQSSNSSTTWAGSSKVFELLMMGGGTA